MGLILLVGLLVRLGVLVFHREVMTLPQGGADEVVFERAAWAFSEGGRDALSSYLTSNSRFLPLLGSFVYDLSGRTPYVLGILMVLSGTALVYVLYRAAFELWNDIPVARLVAWSAALFPQLVQHSALFLRETPASLCLAAAALSAIRFLRRHSLLHIGWFAFWVFLGALFHSGVVFAAPALVVGLLLARTRKSPRRFGFYAVNLAGAIALAGVIVWINETGYGLGKIGGSFDQALDRFEAQEAMEPRGGAAFPEWMMVRGGVSDTWKIPVRYVTFLFSPLLPFMVRSPRHLWGVLDAALYLVLFLAIIRHWRLIWNNRAATALLVVALALLLVYALGVSNFGTAIRHRAKISPLLLLIGVGAAAVGRRPVHGQSLS